METFIRYIKARIEEAKRQLKDLETLIKIGAEVGMDITEYKIRYDNLKSEIEKWERALEKAGVS